jgi:hypothetical protein
LFGCYCGDDDDSGKETVWEMEHWLQVWLFM